MNLQITGYSIYLLITFYITIVTGWQLYRDGIYYLIETLNDKNIAYVVNRFLLTGYYLVNLGYALYAVTSWPEITDPGEMIIALFAMSGRIILLLGILHYFNLWWVFKLKKHISRLNKKIFSNSKTSKL